MKQCKHCQQSKPFNDFYLTKKHYSSRCKACFGLYQKSNPNRQTTVKKYDTKNRETKNEKTRSRYYKDVESTRKYEREKRKRLRELNQDHYKEYDKKWKKENYLRMKNNPEWLLRKTLRSRFLRAIKNDYKQTSCLNLLGCSIQECKKYIESQFKEGMTWENYGSYWHLDEIIPCSAWDLTKEEEQEACFHYLNSQPLRHDLNCSKGGANLKDYTVEKEEFLKLLKEMGIL